MAERARRSSREDTPPTGLRELTGSRIGQGTGGGANQRPGHASSRPVLRIRGTQAGLRGSAPPPRSGVHEETHLHECSGVHRQSAWAKKENRIEATTLLNKFK